MTIYASQTTVSVDKSKAEIEHILSRYGATKFVSGWQHNQAMIAFQMQNKSIRFILPLPTIDDVKHTNTGRIRKTTFQALDQAKRQRWRALLLCVKAKLEAVESGISTFEDEFLAHIILPNNQTIGDWLKPQIDDIYKTKELPKLLM